MKFKFTIMLLPFLASSAFAGHEAREAAAELIALKDGGVLYIFKDGKMAKEDRVGRAVNLKNVSTVEAANGRMIPITSNEVARLEMLLRKGDGGN